MPFDGLPSEPDLTVPSLSGLAYLLRHREMWPRGFRWNFHYRSTCALGLGQSWWDYCDFGELEDTIPLRDHYRLFVRGSFLCPSYVTPDVVAWRIERYLVKSAR